MKLLTLAALSVGLGFGQENDCDTIDKCQEALRAQRSSSLPHFRIVKSTLSKATTLNR